LIYFWKEVYLREKKSPQTFQFEAQVDTKISKYVSLLYINLNEKTNFYFENLLIREKKGEGLLVFKKYF